MVNVRVYLYCEDYHDLYDESEKHNTSVTFMIRKMISEQFNEVITSRTYRTKRKDCTGGKVMMWLTLSKTTVDKIDAYARRLKCSRERSATLALYRGLGKRFSRKRYKFEYEESF